MLKNIDEQLRLELIESAHFHELKPSKELIEQVDKDDVYYFPWYVAGENEEARIMARVSNSSQSLRIHELCIMQESICTKTIPYLDRLPIVDKIIHKKSYIVELMTKLSDGNEILRQMYPYHPHPSLKYIYELVGEFKASINSVEEIFLKKISLLTMPMTFIDPDHLRIVARETCLSKNEVMIKALHSRYSGNPSPAIRSIPKAFEDREVVECMKKARDLKDKLDKI